MNKVMTYANGVHSSVGRYVAQCLQAADDCFTQKRGPPYKTVRQDWIEVDHKLAAVCLEALPDRLSSDCYRQNRNDSFTLVLYNIFCMINPGGAREIECLTKFVREPVGPGDAAGVREMLEEWVVARRRLKVIGNLEMIPKERFDAMSLMVEKMSKQDQRFRKTWDTRCAMMGPGCHDHVEDKFANETENWLRHELKGMESNELLDKAQSRDDMNQDRWYPNTQNWKPRVFKVTAETEEGQDDRRKNFACYNWKRDGKCDRQGCPYSHDPTTWTEYVPKGAGRTR